MEGFLELGLPGATVIDARGMGQIVSTDLPIFSGFRTLFPGSGEESYLVLSVLREEQVEEAIRMLRDVCGDFAEKGTGIVFTLARHRIHRRGIARASPTAPRANLKAIGPMS